MVTRLYCVAVSLRTTKPSPSCAGAASSAVRFSGVSAAVRLAIVAAVSPVAWPFKKRVREPMYSGSRLMSPLSSEGSASLRLPKSWRVTVYPCASSAWA